MIFGLKGNRKTVDESVLVEDAVQWRIERDRVLTKLADSVVFLVKLLGELAAAAGAGGTFPSAVGVHPRVPLSDDEELTLEQAFVDGTAPWMPQKWAGKQAVRTFLTRATIDLSGLERQRVIPLGDLRIVAGHCRSRFRKRKQSRAKWVLELTDGKYDVRLSGEWLTLAWIGHLAKWPEPQ